MISKTLRFEIFKRDGFQCQYCGKQPPEIVLEVDHILSRKRKGKDEIDNLITSCFDCNRGKGSRELKIAPPKTKQKVAVLKEKEMQLREYYKYQERLQLTIQKDITYLNEKWEELSDYKNTLTDMGKRDIKNLLRTFSKYQIEEAMEIAWGYRKVTEWKKFRYMCGILWNKKRQREEDAE